MTNDQSDVYPFNVGYNPTGPLGAIARRLGDDLNDYIAWPRHL
jgi:gluconate 2-dehydrogenase alpha chain